MSPAGASYASADTTTFPAFAERLTANPAQAAAMIADGTADAFDGARIVRLILERIYASGHKNEALAAIDAVIGRQLRTVHASARLDASEAIAFELEHYGLFGPSRPMRQVAADLAATHPDSERIVRATFGLAYCLAGLGETDAAVIEYHRALGDAVSLGDPQIEGYVRLELATCLNEAGRVRDALEIVGPVLATLDRDDDPLSATRALTVSSRSHLMLGDHRAEREAREAVSIAETGGDVPPGHLAAALTTLGHATRARSPQDALPYFERAIAIPGRSVDNLVPTD